MKYRAEIDGLRALAVIPVIFFHAGFDLFRGGYVGVDVFFVISGYLITGILIKEIKQEKFSILNFYERRARRLLPALFFMVLLCIIIGWFTLTPYFYRDLLQTTAAISIFASNILLYIKSGYFSAISELKPFLHTWSLAVEEQFYLLFPIFLLSIWRLGAKKASFLILFISLASILISIWWVNDNPAANFYLLPSRVWELLFGSLAAIIINERRIFKSDMMAFLGLLFIIYAIFFFDELTPFPSVYTLIPVTGTLLLILFADQGTFVARFLRLRFLVIIGLVSYSAYLWHQPIFAYLRHLTFSKPTDLQYFFGIILLIFISFFSWKFIEKPFRDKKWISAKSIFFFSSLVILTTAIIGILGHIKKGFPDRFGPEIEIISKGSFDKNPQQNECHYLSLLNDLDNACLLGSKSDFKPTVALIGDSHGDHFANSLDEYLRFNNLKGYNFAFSGCFPVDFIDDTSNYMNNECFEKISKFLAENLNIHTLFISFRWTTIIAGIGFGEEVKAHQKSLDENISISRGDVIARKLEELAGPRRNLIIIYPSPEAGKDVPNFTVKKRILEDKDYVLNIAYDSFLERNRLSYLALDSVSIPKKISRIYPAKIFCDFDVNICNTLRDGRSIYYDDDHLSNFGASLIMQSINREIFIK